MKFLNSFITTMFIALLLAMAFTGNATDTVYFYVGLEVASLALPSSDWMRNMGILGADVYADTVLQTARAFIKDESNKKFELRPNFTRILDLFMKDREFTIPNLAALRSATTRATEAMYINKKSFTVGTSKSCSPSGEQSGSSTVSLTWATKAVKVYQSFKQHAGNEVSLARALAMDLYNAEVSLWEAIDQAALDYLETNKSDVNAGGSGQFDSAEDIMAIKASNKDNFYNLVAADMRLNNYNPEWLHAHNTMWEAEMRKWMNQGGGNSTNTAFQFAGFQFFGSNLISAPDTLGNGDYDHVGYIVPSGGVAVLDWNDPLNVQGRVSGEKSWGTYQSILRPEFTFDLFKLSACADTSSSGGGTQDVTDTWELSLNYALVKQPTPTGTPIFKYGVLDGETYPT